ncbi:MAG: hypothetical protein J5858_14575, partial [Lentisphaeria bacterium]|nr:hypothetical protein [Lentisphaeria bacterium]
NLAKEYHRSVILYGNAAYYSRFGFRPAAEFGITDAWGEECPAILVCPMGTVDSGAFDEGKVYQTTPEEVCAFDLNFPHRQKHLDSRQIFWVQPCPPPKDPLLKESWDLRNRASRFLKGSGILEAWEGIGGKIRSVGSYRNNLMMRNKDIDLHIYTETLDVSRAMEAVNALLTSPKTRRLTYINGANTDEHCLEWHLEMEDDHGELWTADMIQILAGSRLDGFFEDTAEAIIRALTPESRKRILELKASAPADLKICGVEFYCAVLSGHVTTWEEFLQWRRNNPPESLISWRP